MGVWSVVSRSLLGGHGLRIDGEYYRPENLHADRLVTQKHHAKLGRLARDGYRVVYENTRILPADKVSKTSARFLQATNVARDGLSIQTDQLGYVNETDWNRYPKGRIREGELLIEVKGQAEKVTIVPPTFPSRTLVSGSLFKLTIDDTRILPEYLFAYFSSSYGRLLRHRVKTNTLIGFVSKPALYAIPVFLPETEAMRSIALDVRAAFSRVTESDSLFSSAQSLLESTIGAEALALEPHATHAASYSAVSHSQVVHSNRIDAQCFSSSALFCDQVLNKLSKAETLLHLAETFIKGSQQVETPKGDVPYVSIKHIQKNEVVAEGSCLRYPGMPEACRDDLLLAITGATIGKVGVVHRYGRVAFSGDLLAVRVSDRVNPYYLQAVLTHRIGQVQLVRWITGSTNGHLSPRDVGRVVIPRLSAAQEAEIAKMTRESVERVQESERLLDQAKRRIENLIEEAVA